MRRPAPALGVTGVEDHDAVGSVRIVDHLEPHGRLEGGVAALGAGGGDRALARQHRLDLTGHLGPVLREQGGRRFRHEAGSLWAGSPGSKLRSGCTERATRRTMVIVPPAGSTMAS